MNKSNQRQTAKTQAATVQLLPPRYFALRKAKQTYYVWMFLVMVCTAAFFAVLIPSIMRGQSKRVAHSKIMAQAAPLKDLQNATTQLRAFNEKQERLLGWVESAEPDDSVLQALAVVAAATKPQETGIDIESVDLQLKLEYPDLQKAPPKWAKPHMAVHAHIQDRATAKKWADQIKSSPRIKNTVLKLPPGIGVNGAVTLNAEPVGTRMVP